MKWAERILVAALLIDCAWNMGMLAAGVLMAVWQQIGWVLLATFLALLSCFRRRQLVQQQQRVKELSDLLTRVLSEDVDAR